MVHCGFDVKNRVPNEWRESDRADTIRTQTRSGTEYGFVGQNKYKVERPFG